MLSCSVFSRVCLCVVFLCVRGRPPLWRGFVTVIHTSYATFFPGMQTNNISKFYNSIGNSRTTGLPVERLFNLNQQS